MIISVIASRLLFVVSCLLFPFGSMELICRCWLFVVCCVLFAVCCSLLVVY